MSDFSKVIIRYGYKVSYREEPMEIDFSKINQYTDKFNASIYSVSTKGKVYVKGMQGNRKREFSFASEGMRKTRDDLSEIMLQGQLEFWQELYRKKILRFIEDRGYNPQFVRKIMKYDYEKVSSLLKKINKEFQKDKVNCEPEKKRYRFALKGEILNRILN